MREFAWVEEEEGKEEGGGGCGWVEGAYLDVVEVGLDVDEVSRRARVDVDVGFVGEGRFDVAFGLVAVIDGAIDLVVTLPIREDGTLVTALLVAIRDLLTVVRCGIAVELPVGGGSTVRLVAVDEVEVERDELIGRSTAALVDAVVEVVVDAIRGCCVPAVGAVLTAG